MILRVIEGVLKLELFINPLIWIIKEGLEILNGTNMSSSMSSSAGIGLEIVVIVFFMALIEAVLLIPYLIIRKARKKKGLPGPFAKFSVWLKKNWPWFTAGCVVTVIILFYVIICKIQTNLLFYPNNYYEPPALELENVEKVYLENGKFTGLMQKKGKSKLLVFYYGNAQSSGTAMCEFNDEPMLSTYADFDILIMDYPGYGTSEGEPSGAGMYELADAVGKYVDGLTGYEQKIVAGYSVGTGAAVYAAAKGEWDKLVLLAPYDSMLHVFNTYFPAFVGPMKNLMTNQLPSVDYAPQVTEDVLIVCSDADRVVKSRLSEILRDSFTCGVEFHKLNGYPHGQIFCVEETCKLVENFLK